MNIKRKILNRIKKNQQGAVLLEFAFIAPAFFLILMGVFDFGYSIYARTVLNGAIQDAARESTLATAAGTSVVVVNGTPTTVDNVDSIDRRLQDAVEDIVPFGTIEIDRKSYFDFFDVDRPEIFTDSDDPVTGVPNGICDNNEPYVDENNNLQWDADVGESGVGGPRDVVLYEVTLTYKRIFPLYRIIGSTDTQIINATTVLRNQPYGQQVNNASSIQMVCS